MFRKDYIRRMAEAMVKGMAEVFGLKQYKNYEDAMAAIDELMREIFGLNSLAINALSYEDLEALMQFDGPDGGDKAIILAVLLKEEADICDAKGEQMRSYDRYLRALEIFLRVLEKDGNIELEEYLTKIDDILEKLHKYVLPLGMQELVRRYYERQGNYAKCEDALYEMLESVTAGEMREREGLAKEVQIDEVRANHGQVNQLNISPVDLNQVPACEAQVGVTRRAEVLKRGIAFYERLLLKSDEELLKGNLPRSEVEEGLAGWQEKMRG